MKRGSSKVPDPTNAEELRRRLTIMRNALFLISVRHTNRAELQGDYDKVFEDYKSYLLGEWVYGLVAKDAEGNTIASPPWSLVLAYDAAVRKQAVRYVNQDQMAFPVALRAAWQNATVKERNFTTPLALYTKRPASSPSHGAGPPQQPPSKFQKGVKGRGKAKGSSKGGQGGHCASHTPGGKPICYRFNSGEKCKIKKCKFEHVCGICYSSQHHMGQCTSKDAPRSTPRYTRGRGALRHREGALCVRWEASKEFSWEPLEEARTDARSFN